MPTQSIGLFEAKTHFSELVARAEQGEEVIITRHNKPVAKIVPLTPTPGFDVQRRQRALANIARLRDQITQRGGPVTPEEIREWIHEGAPVIVIDSSYALALVMPDEARPPSAALVFGQPLAAPSLWPLEIANALRSSVKRRRFEAGEAAALCREMNDWEVEITGPMHDDAARHLEFAQAHELTPYDAQYLALALQQGAAIATQDDALARAAERVGLLVHR